MSEIHDEPLTMAPELAARALDHELSEALGATRVVHERRPAKMVTALRIDLDVQARLGAAAAQRGIGTSTLMRQIIEEWVETHLARHGGV